MDFGFGFLSGFGSSGFSADLDFCFGIFYVPFVKAKIKVTEWSTRAVLTFLKNMILPFGW